MKNTLLYLVVTISFTLSFIAAKAQTVQLFSEDFELTPGFTLNGAGPTAGIPFGNNKWAVTNNYTGAPTYANTMSQDSTYGGVISFAPHSRYLHINDVASGITNANYDATNASDNFAFMTSGICTMGMDSVRLSFYYLCEGSANAYGEVYYSINNGAWVQTGQTQYNNKYKWKKETLSNPAFANQHNVRIGFHWVNAAGTPPSNESFAIDDINMTGYFSATGLGAVTMTIDSVTPNPVCQNNYIYIYWHLSDTLCDGSYTILLSDASGTFPTANNFIYNVYYPQTSGVITIAIPPSVTPGPCYKVRIDRTTPFPAITGIPSNCFTINSCPNTITTLQPAATYDTNAVCIGSAIDIPFTSSGVYTANTYYAQLSDATGNFPIIPNIIGSLVSSIAYSFSVPPYQSGSIPGTIPNVAAGCNYYVRVVSTSPISIVSQWGPFCLGQCDINTNAHQDLHFCVTDCAVSPAGSDTTITVAVHSFNGSAIYNSGNTFTTQLLSRTNLSHIGANGIFGSVTATSDTTMDIHIPCRDSLTILGVPIGMNYLRVVATNSNQPDNALGTLIRVTIGATHAVGPTVSALDYTNFTPKDTFCTADQVYPQFSPFNYFDYSSFTWIISGYNSGNPFQNAQGANSNNTGFVFTFNPGIYTLKVQETNNGCVSPYGPAKTIIVTGPPLPMSVTGPSPVCQGDTVTYHAAYYPGTYYNWTNTGGTPVTIDNDTIDMYFPTPGTFQVHVNALNQCGTGSNTRNVLVNTAPPVPTITIASNVLTSSATTGNQWYLNGAIIPGATSQSFTDNTTGVYVVVVTGANGCSSSSLPFTATGINDYYYDGNISIAPNPATSEFTISITKFQVRNIKITDVLGNIVFQSLVSSHQSTIDISNFTKGIYFVQVMDEMKNTINKKIVKQ